MENVELTISEVLSDIQSSLKANKAQYNAFGKYSYRSCEDICESAKPFLTKHKVYLTLNDDIIQVGDRVYVKATATISNGQKSIETTAFARESLSKKGMDESQISGSASSYARKYALSGLLLLDDNKDADSRDNSESGSEPAQKKDSPTPKQLQTLRNNVQKLTPSEIEKLKSMSITFDEAKKLIGSVFQR